MHYVLKIKMKWLVICIISFDELCWYNFSGKSLSVFFIKVFASLSVVPQRHHWKYLYLTWKQFGKFESNFLGQVSKVKASLRKKKNYLKQCGSLHAADQRYVLWSKTMGCNVALLNYETLMWVIYTEQRINQCGLTRVCC